MKFYRHDPDAWLAGTAELNFEQCGAYIRLINLLYSRDGIVPDDDAAIARMLHCYPQLWRRLKNELIGLGKVRVTTDGLLTANGVERTRHLTEMRSILARHSVNVRWDNYRKAKQNNDPLIQGRNTPISEKLYKKEGLAVNSGDNVDNSEPEQAEEPEPEKQEKPRHPLSSTPALDDAMRRFKERWT
jgi:hypothetical protein